MALAVKKSMDQLGIPVTIKTAALAVGLYVAGSYLWAWLVKPKYEALKVVNRARKPTAGTEKSPTPQASPGPPPAPQPSGQGVFVPLWSQSDRAKRLRANGKLRPIRTARRA